MCQKQTIRKVSNQDDSKIVQPLGNGEAPNNSKDLSKREEDIENGETS